MPFTHVRTYSRKPGNGPPKPRPRAIGFKPNAEAEGTEEPGHIEKEKDRSRCRTVPTGVNDFALKSPCNLFKSVHGVQNRPRPNSVHVSKGGNRDLVAGQDLLGLEAILHQESSESSFGISCDSTFDKLLKGKPTEPVRQGLGLGLAPPKQVGLTGLRHTASMDLSGVRDNNNIEKEVLLPYSLEIHRPADDELLPSSFLRTQSKLEDSSEISTKHDLSKKESFKVKRSPLKYAYNLRPRNELKSYFSELKSENGTHSLSSISSHLKTSTTSDSEVGLYENQENIHVIVEDGNEKCRPNIIEESKRVDVARFQSRDTSTPLKTHKKTTSKPDISYLSPIGLSFEENLLVSSLTHNVDSIVLTGQDGTSCGSINVPLSPVCPDVKNVRLSHDKVDNIVSASSDNIESNFVSPFKGWNSNEASKDLYSMTKFQCFDMPTTDSNGSTDLFETNEIATNLEPSKESHLPLAGNASDDKNVLSGTSSVDLLLPVEEIMNLNTEPSCNEPEFSARGINLETDQNEVMPARRHQLAWCTQPVPDLLEDDGNLDAIEEEEKDYMPLEALPRDSYFKRFKGASSLHAARVSRVSKWDSSIVSPRRSSIYGSSRRKSRQSHTVIPGKLLSQPKPQSRTFRDLYGIAAGEPRENLFLSRDLDGSFEEQDSNISRSTTDNDAATARNVVLQRCHQHTPVPFCEAFSETYLNNCRKIGEGVYGEVFMWQDDVRSAVLKIIPIEGDDLVNGERQKKFSEILSEIVITTELSNLRFDSQNQTNGFTEVVHNWCIQDKYPKQLIRQWKQYAEEKHSENDCPDVFSESQLFIVIVLANGGEDLEQFHFNNAKQSKSILLQTAYALAVAEKCLEFEHRDLHWGNVLISRTKEKFVTFKLDNRQHSIPTHGVQVTIIDFTLSRMTYDGCCIFNDLSQDPSLFDSHGDYQFDIYRSMRKTCRDNWNEFVPYTNVLWLHYLVDKMTAVPALGVHYQKIKTKVHREGIKLLKEIQTSLLSFSSSVEFIQSLATKMEA